MTDFRPFLPVRSPGIETFYPVLPTRFSLFPMVFIYAQGVFPQLTLEAVHLTCLFFISLDLIPVPMVFCRRIPTGTFFLRFLSPPLSPGLLVLHLIPGITERVNDRKAEFFACALIISIAVLGLALEWRMRWPVELPSVWVFLL